MVVWRLGTHRSLWVAAVADVIERNESAMILVLKVTCPWVAVPAHCESGFAAIVGAVGHEFWVLPVELAGAMSSISPPPIPVPVPRLPRICQLAPAVSVVPATTDCGCRNWATATAAS